MEADQVDPRSPEEEEEDDLAYKPGENTVAYIKKLINSDKPIPQETFNSAMQVFDLLLNRVNVISSASDRMLLVALSGTDSQSVVRIEFGGPLFSRGKLVVVYQNSGALRDPENWLSKKIDQMQVYATTDVGTTDIDILPPKEKVDKRASYDVNNSKHANEIIDGKYVKIDITKYGSVAGTGDQLESMKIKVDADGNPLDETGKKIVGADGQPITLAEGEALFALKKVGDKYEIIKLEPSNIESTKATGKNTYVTKYKDEFVEFIRDSHTGDIIKDLVDGIDNTFDSWKKDTITKIPAEEQETFKEFVDNVSKPDVKLCNKIMNVKVNGKYDKNNFFMLKSVDKIAQDVTNGSIFTGYTVVTYEDLQKIIKDLEQTDPDTAKKLSQSVWKSDKTNKIRYILWYRDGKLFLVDNRATLKNIIEKNIPDDFLLDLTGDKKKPEGGDEGGKSEEETNTEEQSSTETQTETPAATPTDTGEPKQEE